MKFLSLASSLSLSLSLFMTCSLARAAASEMMSSSMDLPISTLSTSVDDSILEQVKRGEQVAQFTPVSGSPWPESHIYEMIEATPEEAVAVFHDYARHADYMPGVRKSVPMPVNSSTDNIDYLYVVKLPIWLGGKEVKENYTVQDHVSSYDSGASYEIEWKMVRADTNKDIQGSARFESLGNATLLIYDNLIVPGQHGASLGPVVEGAKKSVKEAVQAIVHHVQDEKMNQPDLLQDEIHSLRVALGQA